jgi:hypothetical protein
MVRHARSRVPRRDPSIGALADDLPDLNEQPQEALARLELAALVRQATGDLPDALRELSRLSILKATIRRPRHGSSTFQPVAYGGDCTMAVPAFGSLSNESCRAASK